MNGRFAFDSRTTTRAACGVWLGSMILMGFLESLSVGTAGAETILLTPVADASVSSLEPDKNLGSDDRLYLGNEFGETSENLSRVLLRFDVSSINSVASAELYLSKVACQGCPIPFDLMEITGDWGENTVTWNNQPTAGDLATSGFAFETGDLQAIDVTDIVQNWVKQGSTAFGIEIRATNTLDVQVAEVASREWSTESVRPYLQVEGTSTPVKPVSWGMLKTKYNAR